MEVKIVDRKVYLPKDLVKRANLPERGSCEAIVVGDEIRLRRAASEGLNLVEILKTPARQKIEEMVEAEEVEDV